MHRSLLILVAVLTSTACTSTDSKRADELALHACDQYAIILSSVRGRPGLSEDQRLNLARSEVAVGPARMAADAANLDPRWRDLSAAILVELDDFGDYERITKACESTASN